MTPSVQSLRRWVPVAILGLLPLVLMGPAATWLQCRDLWLDAGATPGTVYMAAGASDQARRIQAVAELGAVPRRVLIGNDSMKNRWSREHQRNLSTCEWAVRGLQEIFADVEEPPRIEVVPGTIHNTDDEMRALALYLKAHSDSNAIVLVTSPFHVRRLVDRFRRYNGEINVSVMPAKPDWRDRAPWIIVAELLKLARDRLGLTHAPLLSRPAQSSSQS